MNIGLHIIITLVAFFSPISKSYAINTRQARQARQARTRVPSNPPSCLTPHTRDSTRPCHQPHVHRDTSDSSPPQAAVMPQ